MPYRDQFPIFSAKPDLTFLDSASTTQKPQSVIDSISNFYQNHNANIHRGIYDLSQNATELYENSRQEVQKFINAKSSQEIIFTRGTTESINLLASTWGRQNIHENDEIIVSTLEHHSNYLPWLTLTSQKNAKLKTIPIKNDYSLDIEKISEIITPHTKLIAITALSNVTGEIIKLENLIKIAHQNGTFVLIDAAQSISHLPTDVQQLDCDFLAFSGHKMFGPTGIGVLYGKYHHLEKLPPYHTGGSMIVNLTDNTPEYHKPPQLFEAGTPNISGAIALNQAIQFIKKIEFKNIHNHCQALTKYTREILSQYPEITIHSPENNLAIFSFSIKNIHPHDVADIFNSENIAIRAGHHCAKPFMDATNIPATSRISLHLYNNLAELDKLDKAIHKCLKIFK